MSHGDIETQMSTDKNKINHRHTLKLKMQRAPNMCNAVSFTAIYIIEFESIIAGLRTTAFTITALEIQITLFLNMNSNA